MIPMGQHHSTSSWQREVRYIFPLLFFAIAADDVFILHIQFYLKFTNLVNLVKSDYSIQVSVFKDYFSKGKIYHN